MNGTTDVPRPERRPRSAGPRALLLTALLLVGAQSGAAQSEDQRPRDQELTEVFSSLALTTDIRLVTMGGAIEEGSLASVGPLSVDVTVGSETIPIGYDFVRSVSVEQGHGTQGAIWGGAAGLVVGSVFGMMYASFDCRTASSCNYTEQQGALRWGAFLGMVGAGTGFMLGRHQVHWHPIFP